MPPTGSKNLIRRHDFSPRRARAGRSCGPSCSGHNRPARSAGPISARLRPAASNCPPLRRGVALERDPESGDSVRQRGQRRAGLDPQSAEPLDSGRQERCLGAAPIGAAGQSVRKSHRPAQRRRRGVCGAGPAILPDDDRRFADRFERRLGFADGGIRFCIPKPPGGTVRPTGQCWQSGPAGCRPGCPAPSGPG